VPDILVNSAGVFGIAPIAETEPAEFERMHEVNLRAPFLMIRAFLPRMLARRSGQIISIGSVAGRRAFPGNAAYSASKFGLRGLHEVLAEEVRGTGVRATLLEPAATDTPLWDPIDPDSRGDLPSRAEMLRAEDVARGALFAASQPAGVEVSSIALRANS
jgi:NAD(P)-dependent dehydrogenase (short-subunit alcohol dehydrogenase family)